MPNVITISSLQDNRTSARHSLDNFRRPKEDDSIVRGLPSFGNRAERVYILEQRRVSKARYSGSSFEADLRALRLSLGQLPTNKEETQASDDDASCELTVRQDKRRKMENLSIGAVKRDEILRSLGFSRKERMAGTKIANIIRRQRRDTNSNRHLDEYHEKVEKVKRALRKITKSPSSVFSRGRKSKPTNLFLPVDKSIRTNVTNLDMSRTMIGSSATIVFDG
ncbi:MAG: hypothetical protein SGARI_001903 [Bacillariaceae sp.]